MSTTRTTSSKSYMEDIILAKFNLLIFSVNVLVELQIISLHLYK